LAVAIGIKKPPHGFGHDVQFIDGQVVNGCRLSTEAVLKAIHVQKLYRPEAGQPDAYTHLQLVLTKPIDWELIRQQYDQVVDLEVFEHFALGIDDDNGVLLIGPIQCAKTTVF
jgi:hypothetical protein